MTQKQGVFPMKEPVDRGKRQEKKNEHQEFMQR